MSKQQAKNVSGGNKNTYLEETHPECMNKLVQLLSSTSPSNKEIKTELFTLSKAINKLISDHQQEKHQKEILLKEIETLKAQKDNALSRLSQVAGNKLLDKNSAIVDLSDPNRPTKIAERFSEIYDNEWTDAFVYLTNEKKQTSVDSIQELLNTAEECHEKCKKCAQDQFLQMKRAITLHKFDLAGSKGAQSQSWCSNQAVGTPSDSQHSKGLKMVPLDANLSKPLAEFRKRIAVDLFPMVKKLVLKEVDKPDDPKGCVLKFKNACIECFWLACVQDPPLHFDFNDSVKEAFNRDTHKPYTVRGEVVEYLVWPTVYIEEKGNLMAKGVVQCVKKTETTQANTGKRSSSSDMTDEEKSLTNNSKQKK